MLAKNIIEKETLKDIISGVFWKIFLLWFVIFNIIKSLSNNIDTRGWLTIDFLTLHSIVIGLLLLIGVFWVWWENKNQDKITVYKNILTKKHKNIGRIVCFVFFNVFIVFVFLTFYYFAHSICETGDHFCVDKSPNEIMSVVDKRFAIEIAFIYFATSIILIASKSIKRWSGNLFELIFDNKPAAYFYALYSIIAFIYWLYMIVKLF